MRVDGIEHNAHVVHVCVPLPESEDAPGGIPQQVHSVIDYDAVIQDLLGRSSFEVCAVISLLGKRYQQSVCSLVYQTDIP